MDNGNNDTPGHGPQEFMCPDGYLIARVPLKAIKLLDKNAVMQRIRPGGVDELRYKRYSDAIADGAYANGVPVVYRAPNGTMFASDLRYSDLVIYAEKNVPVNPGVPRNVVHPIMPVKIIEVASREDIPVQRAIWLEKHK